MLKQILAATAVATLTAGPALADGYYGGGSMKDAPAPIAAWSWSGFYFGGHAGAIFNETDVDTIGLAPNTRGNVAVGARPGDLNFEDEGFLGGVQAGYNHQMGQFVIGFEADISGTDLSDSARFLGTSVTLPSGAPSGLNPSVFLNELEYIGTIRGRLGYAMDRTLFYVTGGYAYGEVDAQVNFFTGLDAPNAGLLQFTGRKSETVSGYTIGGGIEHAVTENVTIKGEALYYELDDTTFVVQNIPGVGTNAYQSTFENEGVMVRAGVNLKFNGLFNGGAGY